MDRKDILNRFVSEVWLGTPSLKNKLDHSNRGKLTYQSDQYAIIVTKVKRNECSVAIMTNSREKDILFFGSDERGQFRISAQFCSNEEASVYLDYMASHLTEIINNLKYGQKLKFD